MLKSRIELAVKLAKNDDEFSLMDAGTQQQINCETMCNMFFENGELKQSLSYELKNELQTSRKSIGTFPLWRDLLYTLEIRYGKNLDLLVVHTDTRVVQNEEYRDFIRKYIALRSSTFNSSTLTFESRQLKDYDKQFQEIVAECSLKEYEVNNFLIPAEKYDIRPSNYGEKYALVYQNGKYVGVLESMSNSTSIFHPCLQSVDFITAKGSNRYPDVDSCFVQTNDISECQKQFPDFVRVQTILSVIDGLLK